MNASNNSAPSSLTSDTIVKVNLSVLQHLAHYGLMVNEFQNELAALKAIAATRPLTEVEEQDKGMWEYNLEFVVGVLQSRVEQFETTLAEVA